MTFLAQHQNYLHIHTQTIAYYNKNHKNWQNIICLQISFVAQIYVRVDEDIQNACHSERRKSRETANTYTHIVRIYARTCAYACQIN